MKYRHVSSRLDRIEVRLDIREDGETSRREQERILEQAQHANRCRHGEDYGMHPLFDIREEGVYCTYDGKKVRTSLQTGAEAFYWMFVYQYHPELIHDEEEQAFYDVNGVLVLSRDYLNVCRWGDATRAWERRNHLQGVG